MKYTLDEIAAKLLETTHIIGISTQEDRNKDTAQSDALDVLKQKLTIDSNLNLGVGAIVANEMRDAVLERTKFTCSAGIAHNKMLAKLVAGMHKPQQQTVVFFDDVPKLYKTMKIGKVRHLGGKLGQQIQETFQIETMSQLSEIDISTLKQHFGDKNGDWIFWLAKGIDSEPIRNRTLPQSVGCCKNFRGPDILNKTSKVSFWLHQLSSEVCERLDQEIEVNNRVATHMIVNFKNPGKASMSRSCKINKVDAEQIKTDALRMIREFNRSDSSDKWDPPIVLLGISTSKFEEYESSGSKSMKDFLVKNSVKSSSLATSLDSLQNSSSLFRDTKLNTNRTENKPLGLKRFFVSSKNNKLNESSSCKDIQQMELGKEEDLTTSSLKGKEETDNNFESHEAVRTHKNSSSCSIENASLLVGCNEDRVFSKHTTSCDDTSFGVDSIQREANHEEPPVDRNAASQSVSTSPSFAKTSCGLKADDFAICSKCGKRVLHWELPEHNDFHFAQDLQHDINKTVNSSQRSDSKSSPPRKKVKPNSSLINHFFKPK
eukprot:gene13193-4002_t